MKKHLKFLVLILLLATVCSSCKKENLDDYNYVEERQNEAITVTHVTASLIAFMTKPIFYEI